MKTIAAGKFKAHCLAVIDEVYELKEEVVITKHGKPMAKLMPIRSKPDDIFGFMKNKGMIAGDVVAPIEPKSKWNSDK